MSDLHAPQEPVLVTTAGHIAVLTLNRPEARNAVNPELRIALSGALDRFEADPELWVGVLTGAPPVFCAGADLTAIRDGRVDALVDEHGFAGLTRRRRTKVLIAAVEGAAFAGGAELALACDLLLASRTATFGIPEVKRSLVANAGGLVRLPHKIPVNVAMELALTGDPFTADRAYGFGLVNELCEPGTVLERALAMAERIGVNAPVAVRESRAVIEHGARLDEADAWAASQRAFDTALNSEDGREGLTAFIEKRSPLWSGR